MTFSTKSWSKNICGFYYQTEVIKLPPIKCTFLQVSFRIFNVTRRLGDLSKIVGGLLKLPNFCSEKNFHMKHLTLLKSLEFSLALKFRPKAARVNACYDTKYFSTYVRWMASIILPNWNVQFSSHSSVNWPWFRPNELINLF